uniref:Uncharacterized protein n=1 Tax=Arundo donax TaxID=35708 RepID=A0A0A9F6U5_ARUDO
MVGTWKQCSASRLRKNRVLALQGEEPIFGAENQWADTRKIGIFSSWGLNRRRTTATD